MTIVATEIESIHGSPPQQLVFYRCQDHLGEWHSYGPVIVNDNVFDKESHKAIVAEKMTEHLAAQEFLQIVGG